MKKKTRKNLCAAVWLLAAFVLWTAAVRFIDVEAIGPRGSAVGLASVNRFIHNLTGVHMTLYVLTDWLSLIPLGFMLGFALLVLVQWVKRKQLRQVDYSILVLGGFYLVVLAVYLLFEVAAVNYRPVLIHGVLEVSYPSSTTMLVLCVMPTAAMQLEERIENHFLRHFTVCAIGIFTASMVLGRLVSGVHWFSDIIGGVLLSASLVMLYRTVCGLRAADE